MSTDVYCILFVLWVLRIFVFRLAPWLKAVQCLRHRKDKPVKIYQTCLVSTVSKSLAIKKEMGQRSMTQSWRLWDCRFCFAWLFIACFVLLCYCWLFSLSLLHLTALAPLAAHSFWHPWSRNAERQRSSSSGSLRHKLAEGWSGEDVGIHKYS